MRSTFRVLFYLKKGAPLKNGMLPIMVRITIDGEKVEFSTKLEIEEKKWDIKSAKAAGRTPAANEINLKLDKMRVEFNNHYEKIRSVGSFPTPNVEERLFGHQGKESHDAYRIQEDSR